MSGAALIVPGPLVAAELEPPISKSDAQRALVLAHAVGRRELADLAPWRAAGLPDDVEALERGLAALASAPPQVDVDCGEGGAPFRFLLAQAAIATGKRVRLHGSARLGERPRSALIEALRASLEGSGFRCSEGSPWPIEVTGGDPRGEPRFRVSAGESSQFASALLLAAAALAHRQGRTWSVALEGPTASAGYLSLTLHWMRAFGFDVEVGPAEISARAGAPPARAPAIPGDWSSLGYLLLIAWKAGGSVTGADLSAPHPDRALVPALERIGLRVRPAGPSKLTVAGAPERGLEGDGRESPDLLPTLAALACTVPGESVLRNASILRAKESDRLEGILRLAKAAGAGAELRGDALFLRAPATPPRRLAFDPHGDHRMAMSAATLAVLTGAELELADAECVRKSFPRFWKQLARAGVARRAPGRPQTP